jgi:Zn-dependent peptidase ImmA (M78 family)
MAVRRKHIRTIVEKILEDRQIRKAPVAVESIVHSLGIQIKSDRVDDALSGFLVRGAETGTAVIGVNAGHSQARRRFTVAHELGHYLLHEGEVVHFDGERPGFTVNLRNQESATGESDLEREANLFAAELLMPARFLERDLPKVRRIDLLDEALVLKELAEEYKVSVQALTFRLANLGLIK